MRFQSRGMVIGLSVILIAAAGKTAAAQQDAGTANGSNTPPMSLSSGGAAGSSDYDPEKVKETLFKELRLKIFEATAGNLSLCENDQHCLSTVQNIKALNCASNVCDGSDKGKEATACFGDTFDNNSVSEKKNISEAICAAIKSPSPETRQALLSRLPDSNENELVQYEAYLLALKGSGPSCQKAIKDFVGDYGPNWNFDWYRAMAGCSILSQESTHEQMEKEFYKWFTVARGTTKCADISDPQLRTACSTPNVTFPQFSND